MNLPPSLQTLDHSSKAKLNKKFTYRVEQDQPLINDLKLVRYLLVAATELLQDFLSFLLW